MADLPTPTQVALGLADLARLLDVTQVELVHADERAVRARHRHEVGYAKAFLNADASNADGRKCMAVIATEVEKLDAEIADLQVRSLRTKLQVLRDRVHIGQSMGAAVRSEWAATP